MSRALRSVILVLVGGVAAALWLGNSSRAADSNAPLRRPQIEAIIHDYLMQHPDVLIAALRQAEDKLHQDEAVKASQAVSEHQKEVFSDPSTPIGGNPQGDVALVEFFDYRCPYCKQVEPSLETMLKQDPQLRLVYKEFPILGPVSVVAARAALAAQRQGKYDAFHDAMMEARGNITDDTVYRVAGSVGLDVDKLKHDMASPEIAQEIKSNLKLADALDIHGTPAFVIDGKVVPGAADIDTLKSMVSDARKK
ncbi:MAG TPA: DsbA family protein [Stellaceae bacterium]|nr:DsbA family protein [Stellaceae bacterium]